MSTREKVNIFIDGKEISTTTGYKFLRALVTNDGYTKDEIKNKPVQKAMTKLTKS